MKFAIGYGVYAKVHIVDETQPSGQVFESLCGLRPKRGWRAWHHAKNYMDNTCVECTIKFDCLSFFKESEHESLPIPSK